MKCLNYPAAAHLIPTPPDPHNHFTRQSLQQNFFRSICTDVLGILVEVAEPEWVPFSNQPKPNLRRNIKDARFAFPILNTLQLRLNHLILYNATYIR